MFGRKRRRRARQDEDEVVRRLDEVCRQIDRRPLGQIDLRDVASHRVIVIEDEPAPAEH